VINALITQKQERKVNQMKMPRMRTAAGVLAEIKAVDPGTEVTLSYLRRLIKTRQVPVTEVGCKKLVNVDAVMAFLSGEDEET
jgi:hypothetical protein